MYYELGVVKKFQIPQEVRAGKSWDLLCCVYSRLAHAVAGTGAPVRAQHSSQNSHGTGFMGVCREGVVYPEAPHPAEGMEQSLMRDWSIKLASSALFCSSLPETSVGLLCMDERWTLQNVSCTSNANHSRSVETRLPGASWALPTCVPFSSGVCTQQLSAKIS